MMTFDPTSVQALTFDVFGTVVDWRGSIIAEGQQFNLTKNVNIDWAKFADAWRGGYEPAMLRVRKGELPWLTIDRLHRMILDRLLVEYNLTQLSDAQKDHLNRVWHRLNPWPDAISGLQRLRSRYVVAALSNGNIALLTNMAKHAGLPWDCILSAELAKHYKPDPEVYLTAAELLGLEPSHVLMVAAHPHDLAGAKSAGMRTAYIPRPQEYGPNRPPAQITQSAFDVVAEDLNVLADQLGC